jgi:hypothetical protein
MSTKTHAVLTKLKGFMFLYFFAFYRAVQFLSWERPYAELSHQITLSLRKKLPEES